jgi:hypothetical protein
MVNTAFLQELSLILFSCVEKFAQQFNLKVKRFSSSVQTITSFAVKMMPVGLEKAAFYLC